MDDDPAYPGMVFRCRYDGDAGSASGPAPGFDAGCDGDADLFGGPCPSSDDNHEPDPDADIVRALLRMLDEQPAERPYIVARMHPPIRDLEFSHLDIRGIARVMAQVIAIEAPIEKGLLFSRTYRAFGVGRRGRKVVESCERALKLVRFCKMTVEDGRTIIWRADQDPRDYRIYRVAGEEGERREVAQLPLEEIAAAAQAALIEEGPLDVPAATRATALKLGYERVGSRIRDFLPKGMALASRRGWICARHGMYAAVQPTSQAQRRA